MAALDTVPSNRPVGSGEDVDRLEAHVRARLGNRLMDLRVTESDGGLVLSGRASTYHEKQLAQHEVMRASRTPIAANRIEVCRPPHDRAAGPPGDGPPNRRVLVATGDGRLRSAARGLLTEHGFTVAIAADGAGCVTAVRELESGVDVAVLDSDLLLGGADGVIDHLRVWSGKPTPVVLLTSQSATVDPPAAAVIRKPVRIDALLRAVLSAAREGPPPPERRRGGSAPPPFAARLPRE